MAALRAALVLGLLAAGGLGGAVDRTLAWTVTYNNPVDGDDIPQGVAISGAGDVYVAGWEKLASAGNTFDIRIVKYHAAGQVAWTRTHNSFPGGTDFAFGIALGPDGSVYVAGSVSNTGGASDGWLRKYSADGDELWTSLFVNPSVGEQTVLYAVAVDPVSGSLFVAGTEVQSATLFQFGNGLVAKVSPATGAVLWRKTWDGAGTGVPWDEALAVAVAPDGGAVVTGYETQKDLTPGGELTADILGRQAARFKATGTGADTRIVVRWYAADGGEPFPAVHFDGDPLVTSTKEAGNAVAVDTDGSVYVAGLVEKAGPSLFDRWVTKYANPGGPYGSAVMLWNRTIGESTTGGDTSDTANGMALDPLGGVLVAGESAHDTLNQGQNFTIEEYDPTQAFWSWKTSYGSAYNRDDMALAIAANANGDVAVAGWANRGDLGERKNWVVLKFSPPPAPPPLLGNTRAWPSPFNPDSAAGGVAKFGPLPSGGTVKIYTLGGWLVREVREQLGIARWDGRNGDGTRVTEGVYFWVAQVHGQTAVKGTLAVTRR